METRSKTKKTNAMNTLNTISDGKNKKQQKKDDKPPVRKNQVHKTRGKKETTTSANDDNSTESLPSTPNKASGSTTRRKAIFSKSDETTGTNENLNATKNHLSDSNDKIPIHDMIPVTSFGKRKREINPPVHRDKIPSCVVRLNRMEVQNLISNSFPQKNEKQKKSDKSPGSVRKNQVQKTRGKKETTTSGNDDNSTEFLPSTPNKASGSTTRRKAIFSKSDETTGTNENLNATKNHLSDSNDKIPIHNMIPVTSFGKRKCEINPSVHRAKIPSCVVRLNRMEVQNLISNSFPQKNEKQKKSDKSPGSVRKNRIQKTRGKKNTTTSGNDDNSTESLPSTQNKASGSTALRSKRKRETNLEDKIAPSKSFGKKDRSKPKKKNKLEIMMQHEAPINEFIVNEVVLVTISGYAPWPARILKIVSETIYVEFFGTGQINPVRSNAISRLEIPKMLPFLQRRGYKKAIMELEHVFEIPSDLSLLS